MTNQIATQVSTVLQPVVLTIVTVLGGYITKQAVKILPALVKYLIQKLGAANYAHLRTIGQDVWGIIEEDKRLNQLSSTKIEAFGLLMKQRFPSITDEDINFVRQAIAGEVNKDKTAISNTINATEQEAKVVEKVVIEPKKIYVTPEGLELQPKAGSQNLQQ